MVVVELFVPHNAAAPNCNVRGTGRRCLSAIRAIAWTRQIIAERQRHAESQPWTLPQLGQAPRRPHAVQARPWSLEQTGRAPMGGAQPAGRSDSG